MNAAAGLPAVETLPASATEAAVGILADAFRDYPVMRWVLGERDGYDADLRALIGFFVSARVLRGEPLLGQRDTAGELAGVALVTEPRTEVAPPSLARRREEIWDRLGEEARRRYEAFGAATLRFALDEPHLHLNMLGVLRSHHGRGLARPLLEAVHDLSLARDDSAGVSLTTESPPNVPLYEHFGYRVLGHATVSPRLETWVMFRPDGG